LLTLQLFRNADGTRHGHLSRDVFRKITDALARHGVELVPEA
jgi:hypothetical protein